MNGQSFAFNGYLPIEHKQRNQSITKFEKKAVREEQAQLFIETPYRSEALFKNFLKTLDPNTRLCVACDLFKHRVHTNTFRKRLEESKTTAQ